LSDSDRVEAERLRAKVEYWKQVVYIQTHFNDMCIRTRWVGLTVNATIYAGAAVALAQYPRGLVNVFNFAIHISAILFTIAGLVSVALWQLDRLYYYKMLIASVDHAEQLEDRLKELIPGFIGSESITRAITRKVSRNHSRNIVGWLYVGMCVVPFVLALLTFAGTSDAQRTDASIAVETTEDTAATSASTSAATTDAAASQAPAQVPPAADAASTVPAPTPQQ